MPPEASERPLALIAERDPNVRALQKHFLERAGFEVEFPDDGVALLERARLAPPAVIITEILLPRLDGLTLCRRLREDPITQDVPVIVFSILSAGARAIEAGAEAFLRKPFIESTFLAAVRNAVAAKSPGITEQQWAAR
jgi:CheY-like chemotaxis protein